MYRNDLSRYALRDQVLLKMGFASYAAYLQSDLWKSIRSRVLARYRHKCQSCRAAATEVHHKHYSRAVLRGEHIIGLKAICRACHQYIEFDCGKKTDVPTANERLQAISVKKKKPVRLICSVCKKNRTKRKQTICSRCKNGSRPSTEPVG